MTAAELVRKLKLPDQTQAAIDAISLPENHQELKESFFMEQPYYAANSPHELSLLRLYLDWTVDTKARFDALGIPEIYFWDSMKDIAIWCDDYLAKYHVPGFKEWEWVGRNLRLEVIRIGRLLFEPLALSQEVSLNGNAYPVGTPMLDVHIPAGEPLNVEDALSSSLEFSKHI